MPSEPRRANAVSVRGVWKRYGLPWPSRRSARDGARAWALRDVHLTVASGEAVALLGRNGAAKTTLLRLIAGVTPPSAGTVEVHGSLFPLVGLDGAIHPELKGRENVRLLATLAGMPARARDLAMADIERFTQLGPWFDRPVRTYSLGMSARLGVAVALHSGCDILLLDEALAVGDLEFQNACLRRVRALRDAGTTVLFATHNLDLAELMADRTVVLEGGEVRFVGPPAEAGGAYEDIVFAAAHRRAAGEPHRERHERVRLRHARVYDGHDRTVTDIDEQTPFGLELGLAAAADARWRLSVGWRNVGGVVCVWHMVDLAPPPPHGDGPLVLRIWYPENHLVKGAYVADVRLMAWETGEVAATWAAAESVNVRATHRARGIANMRAECVVRGPFGERPLPTDTEPLAWTEA